MKEKTYRNDWMEFTTGFGHFNFQYDLGGYFDSRHMLSICLGWGRLFVHLPWGRKYNECEPPRYGLYYFESTLWFCWGRKVKAYHMPWDLEWVRTSALRRDGKWEHEQKGDRKDFWDDKWNGILWRETYPYKYVLKNGEVQERLATIRVEEREWRPRWTKRWAMFRRIVKSIDVDFNKEVGERVDTWKGGCVGCGYTMLPNETPEITLRRMEFERKFN